MKEALKLIAIGAFNALNESSDQEKAHSQADEILLKYLDAIGEKEVADAYRETREKVGFWYA